MVLVKNLNFFFRFWQNRLRKGVWRHIVNRKLASEDYRNIDLRKSKNLHFSKKLEVFFVRFFAK